MNYNPSYKKNVLRVLADDADKISFGFQFSAPSKIAGSSRRWAFSLPAGPDFTCPGATESCRNCYAQKGFHQFYSPQKVFLKNWITMSYFARNNDVAGAADLLITAMPADAPVLRCHESGDFSDQFAIQVWTEVARQKPNTKFWFYTRSFNLDFTELVSLPNVNGWVSTDPHNTEAATTFAAKYNMKQAWGPWKHDQPLPPKSFACPATTKKLATESACFKCQLCIHKDRTNKNVVFMEH